ncbi:hypothetical protein KLEB273_gp142 [Bacillus phage vB_BauM_KLEB27-3]|nr:hypothetical protein KLEB273_gp142 [Bacillus phage vB_BauM_KLEB27-3]
MILSDVVNDKNDYDFEHGIYAIPSEHKFKIASLLNYCVKYNKDLSDLTQKELESFLMAKIKFTKEQTETITEMYENETAVFYHQDMEDENKKDAITSINSDHLDCLIDENEGIIGYISKDYANDIAAALNLFIKKD